MNKIIICVVLIVGSLLANGQQKANVWLRNDKKREIVGISGNSMAIHPEFINNSDRFWYSFSDGNGKILRGLAEETILKRLLFDDDLLARCGETRGAGHSWFILAFYQGSIRRNVRCNFGV